jgi:TPP-dependent pyruvate/acetoin dehydrogenase alpha subunit
MRNRPRDYWEDRSDLLAGMLMVRAVETHLLDMFARGLLSGTVHTCWGQEACAVGVAAAIDLERDILFSNHRGHGHYLGYCGDIEGLVAEIAGLPTGVCGGVGGSQHIQRDNFYTNGIQGASAPIVAGMALAEKRKKTGAIAIAFLGDGTFGEGAVYEAMNIAALWSLPVTFVVENNRIAQTTPSKLQHAGDLAERARPFGISIHRGDGQDVDAVQTMSREAVDACRKTGRPQLLFLDTERFGPHSKGDDTRASAELSLVRARDPIDIYAGRHGRIAELDIARRGWTEKLAEIEALLFKAGTNALS